MSLMEQRSEGIHVVRWVRAESIAVDGTEQSASFVLAPDALVPWAPQAVEQIDDDAIAQVLALRPELVLLGTGQRQRMPPPRVMGAFLSKGIGLEAMDNAAAGRTFNLLAGEGRRVVAALLLPG